jgi:hypothetical protein
MSCIGPITISTIDWSRDHRGIKQRYYPMRGFGNFASASRFCRAIDEVCQFFRFHTTMKQKVTLGHQHDLFRQRLDAVKDMFAMVSHKSMRAEAVSSII